MAEKAGVNKLPVSRESIDAGAWRRKSPSERDFSEKDLPIIYTDGIQFDRFHALAAVGVDAEGDTHVPELRDGARENAEVVKGLLEDLVERGAKPSHRRLFVIDGFKALCVATD